MQRPTIAFSVALRTTLDRERVFEANSERHSQTAPETSRGQGSSSSSSLVSEVPRPPSIDQRRAPWSEPSRCSTKPWSTSWKTSSISSRGEREPLCTRTE